MPVIMLYPGYIQSELSVRVRKAPFVVSAEGGVWARAKAIEREPVEAKDLSGLGSRSDSHCATCRCNGWRGAGRLTVRR